MRSYDLFNTLAASRTGLNAGEALVEDHIPIEENVAKVEPEDIIISDYYNPDKARRILQDVCGLNNALLCTEDGKATGKVWKGLQIEHHLGDNPHSDYASPRQHGIPAELTTAWQPTEREKACGDLGWVMREARLTTWHDDPVIRGLQLHQTERNFPFLYAAAYAINRKMVDGGFEHLLLCSRDCWLLHELMNVLPWTYSLKYFYTSRLTRYRPSESYRAYAAQALSDKALVVDMNGSGNSLKFMTDMLGGTPLLVNGFGNAVPFLVGGGIRETSNLAPEPMVADMQMSEKGRWNPVFVNPTGQDWQKPTIIAMHQAFDVCVKALERRPYGDVIVPTYRIESALRGMVDDPALEPLWADHLADSTATYELLNRGPLPHPVIL